MIETKMRNLRQIFFTALPGILFLGYGFLLTAFWYTEKTRRHDVIAFFNPKVPNSSIDFNTSYIGLLPFDKFSDIDKYSLKDSDLQDFIKLKRKIFGISNALNRTNNNYEGSRTPARSYRAPDSPTPADYSTIAYSSKIDEPLEQADLNSPSVILQSLTTIHNNSAISTTTTRDLRTFNKFNVATKNKPSTSVLTGRHLTSPAINLNKNSPTTRRVIKSLPPKIVSLTVNYTILTALTEGLKNLREDFIWPIRIEKVNNLWQKTTGIHAIYVMNAYYDDRSTNACPRIAIIAIEKVMPVETAIQCIFWYNVSSSGTQMPRWEVQYGEKVKVGIGSGPKGHGWHVEHIIACNVTNNGIPDFVSVVSQHNIVPSVLMRVRIPEKPEKHEDINDFGHCMAVTYFKQDPVKMVEWFEVHKMWGIGEFNLYGYKLDNNTLKVIEYYRHIGYVKYTELEKMSTFEVDDETIRLSKSPVINDCLYRNMHRYRYIVCSDFDEFIVPRKHLNYSHMIGSIEMERFHREKSQNRTHKPASSYYFRNCYFFFDFGPVNNDHWNSVSLRYQRRVEASNIGYSAKSITRAEACVGMQNHKCWMSTFRLQNSAWNENVDMSVGLSQHYKKCHFDSYTQQNGTCAIMMRTNFTDVSMLRFKTELLTRIKKPLVDLSLAKKSEGNQQLLFRHPS